MKTLSENELMNSVKSGHVDRRALTPTQQERLVRSVRASIDKLTEEVGKLTKLSESTAVVTQLSSIVESLNSLTSATEKSMVKPALPTWTFSIERNKDGHIKSIRATPG